MSLSCWIETYSSLRFFLVRRNLQVAQVLVDFRLLGLDRRRAPPEFHAP